MERWTKRRKTDAIFLAKLTCNLTGWGFFWHYEIFPLRKLFIKAFYYLILIQEIFTPSTSSSIVYQQHFILNPFAIPSHKITTSVKLNNNEKKIIICIYGVLNDTNRIRVL